MLQTVELHHCQLVNSARRSLPTMWTCVRECPQRQDTNDTKMPNYPMMMLMGIYRKRDLTTAAARKVTQFTHRTKKTKTHYSLDLFMPGMSTHLHSLYLMKMKMHHCASLAMTRQSTLASTINLLLQMIKTRTKAFHSRRYKKSQTSRAMLDCRITTMKTRRSLLQLLSYTR